MPGCGCSTSPAEKSRNESLAAKMSIGIGNSGADIIFFSTALTPEGGVRWPAQKRIWLRASDRKSTRLNSSHVRISYAVFCLKKKNKKKNHTLKQNKKNTTKHRS